MRGLFVAGTDTGVGKTRISVGLVERLRESGVRVAAMKPVASGCEVTAEGLRNEDALALQAAAALPLPYPRVNPFAFEPPVAPHIAAAEAGVTLSVAEIAARYRDLAAEAETVVVEGVGGWLVPLNESETMADLAAALNLPVVLVVAIRLGCINHALLAAESIRARGLELAGWVANLTDGETPRFEENIATLAGRIPAPHLGTVPRLAAGESAAPYLTVPPA